MPGGKEEKMTIVRNCRDCQQQFHLPAGEQQWYADQKWTLPTRCKACRDARQRNKQEQREQAAQNQEPSDGRIDYRFDPEMMEYLQHDLSILEGVAETLQSQPSNKLTTFKDLDKIFSIIQETLTAARFLKLIPGKPEQNEEETQLKFSPQRTNAEEETEETVEEEDEVISPPASVTEMFVREASSS